MFSNITYSHAKHESCKDFQHSNFLSGERGMRIKLNSHPNPNQLFCLQHIIKNHMYQMLSKTCSTYLHQDPPANNEPLSLPGHPLLWSRTERRSLSMVLHHAQFLKPTPELRELGVSEQDFAILDSSNWEALQLVRQTVWCLTAKTFLARRIAVMLNLLQIRDISKTELELQKH